MEIEVSSKSLKKTLEDDRRRVKAFGSDIAGKIAIRMTSLLAARSLADFWPPFRLPERCHELKKGNLKGVFSMDLKHPFRLLFRPLNETQVANTDELERWKEIQEIDIIAIKDTHD